MASTIISSAFVLYFIAHQFYQQHQSKFFTITVTRERAVFVAVVALSLIISCIIGLVNEVCVVEDNDNVMVNRYIKFNLVYTIIVMIVAIGLVYTSGSATIHYDMPVVYPNRIPRNIKDMRRNRVRRASEEERQRLLGSSSGSR
jgi:p-aminobenzoyl-glutamate transporter AbgT